MRVFPEDDLVKKKLVISAKDDLSDEHGAHLLLRSLIQWCSMNKNASHEEKKVNYERMAAMLSNCEAAMSKSQQMLKMNQLEMKNYEELYVKIERCIADAQLQIITSKADLQLKNAMKSGPKHASKRGHGEVDNHDERRAAMERLNLLEANIKKLQVVKDDLNVKLEKRRRQFNMLRSAANELHLLLVEGESAYGSKANYDSANCNSNRKSEALLVNAEPLDVSAFNLLLAN